MYICLCKAVTESRVRRAVDAGMVMSLKDLTRELGVGTGCGKCVPAAREALNAAMSRGHQPPSAGSAAGNGFAAGAGRMAGCAA